MWIGRWIGIGGAAVCGTLFAAGCEDSVGPEDVGSIVVEADRTELEIDETVQLRATVLNRSGVVITGSVTWTSADPTAASVSEGGLVTARAAGIVEIRASSGSVTGVLDITVRPATCIGALVEGTLTSGDEVEGSLEPSDCVLFNGPYADAFTLHLDEPGVARIDLAASSFNPVVLVTDPTLGFVGFAEGGAPGTDARLMQPLAPGDYIVWATSFQEGRTGSYLLSLDVSEATSCSTPVGSIALDETVTAALDDESCVSGSFGRTDPWSLELDESVDVRIDLRSDDFDTMLFLTDASGQVIGLDDDGGGMLNSRLTLSLPAGAYTIWAASFTGGGVGSYELTVQQGAGATDAVPSEARPHPLEPDLPWAELARAVRKRS